MENSDIEETKKEIKRRLEITRNMSGKAITKELILKTTNSKITNESSKVLQDNKNKMIDELVKEYINVIDAPQLDSDKIIIQNNINVDKNNNSVITDVHIFLPESIYILIKNKIVYPSNLTLVQIINKCRAHFIKKVKEKCCKGIENGKIIITDNIQNNSSGDGLKLEGPLEYELFPYELIENLNIIFPENFKFDEKNTTDLLSVEMYPITPDKSSLNKNAEFTHKQKLLIKRFINFLKYFANLLISEIHLKNSDDEENLKLKLLPQTYIEELDLTNTYNKLKEKKGLSDLAEDIKLKLHNFTKPYLDKSKGIIFYGPPRTGKTFTTTLIIDYLKLFKVYPNLSAADFSQGIVGQSEKMIDAITKRTEVIPWELCILYIDEIDSLVPNRLSSMSSNSQNSIIGQLLAIIDGNKKKKNLLVIGTTNRLEQMDSAFIQRMDIQFFLGVPNFKGRKDWINKFISDKVLYNNNHNINNGALSFINNDDSFQNTIMNMTLNFSADGIKKLLGSLVTKLEELVLDIDRDIDIDLELNNDFSIYKVNNFSDKKDNNHNYDHKKIIDECIFFTILNQCMDDRYYFGKFYLPNIIKSMPSNIQEDPEYNSFYCLLSEIKQSIKSDKIKQERLCENYLTKRIFVDLCLGESKELEEFQELQFQVEYAEKFYFDSDLKNIFYGQLNDKINLDNYNKIVDDLKEIFLSRNYYEKDIEMFLNNLEQIKSNWIEQSKQNEQNKQFNQVSNTLKLNYVEVFQILIANLFKRQVKNYPKLHGFKSLDEVIKMLIVIGFESNLDFILFLDQSYFAKKNINDENRIIEELTGVIEETKRYKKAMIIIDFDSLCPVFKEYSSHKSDLMISNSKFYELDSNEVNFTENIQNNKVFQTCIYYFEEFLDTHANHWIIGISSQPKVSMLFKEKIKWPKTSREIQLEENIEKTLEEKQCLRCNEMFSEKTNKIGSCMRHISENLYLESEYSKYANSFSKSQEIKNNFVAAELFENNQKLKKYEFSDVIKLISNGKLNCSQVRWACCGKSLFEKGEKADVHISE